QRDRHRHTATLTAGTGDEYLVAQVPTPFQPVLGVAKEVLRNRRAILEGRAHDFDEIGQPWVERLCALQLCAKAVCQEIVFATDSRESTYRQVIANVDQVALR